MMEPKNRKIDKNLKVMLLQAIQRGEFTDQDFQVLRETCGLDLTHIEIIDRTGLFSKPEKEKILTT